MTHHKIFLIALAVAAPLTAAAAQASASVDQYNAAVKKRTDCIAALNDTKAANRQGMVEKKVISIQNDQEALQKFSLEFKRLNDELTAAKAKRDSVGIRKVNDDIVALLSVDAKADSLAILRKCGPVTPKPASGEMREPLREYIPDDTALADMPKARRGLETRLWVVSRLA